VTDDGQSTRRVGRYEVEREIAEGGMGVVYLALQPQLERPVVLKRMHRDLQGDEEAEQRFLREARTAAAIHHPNVVGVYDCFTWRGEPYIACEYVDGLDAASALAKAGHFPSRTAALIALEIARGLEELHARGLVHRDLKPDNVLLGRAGEVKIADFGIAHDPKEPALTRSGVSLGTPAYMSPEQLRGERVDFRADLFALGALLYELLSGATPFAPPSPEEKDAEPSQLRRIERGHFEPLRRAAPDTPRALARIVHRCLRAHPKRRIGSTAELRRLLERHVGTATPGDNRREIAEWLDDRKLLPARGKTKRGKHDEDPAPPGRALVRRAFRFALAAAIAGLFLALALASPDLTPRTSDWPVLAKRWLPQEPATRVSSAPTESRANLH
jgi:serine/threonine protein kinase